MRLKICGFCHIDEFIMSEKPRSRKSLHKLKSTNSATDGEKKMEI